MRRCETSPPDGPRATEAGIVDAFIDRLIPTDELGAGAKDAGVVTFIDRQLTGPYGGHDWLYMQGPWKVGSCYGLGLRLEVDDHGIKLRGGGVGGGGPWL